MTASQPRKATAGIRPQSTPWIWLAALTILAAVVRIIGLNKGLWLDEIYFVVDSVRQPMAKILTSFPGDNQHPLYTILARVCLIAFGEHPWSVRLPAVFFGVASIPALYFLGARIVTRAEAFLAAAMLTLSYHHVWFSQNARGYTALAFWTILGTLLLLKGLETNQRSAYLWYGVTIALGVYTHLTMMFVVASHVLVCGWVFWQQGRRRPEEWKFPAQGFVLGGGLALLLYSPIALQVGNFFMHRPSRMKAVSTPAWALAETIRSLIAGLGGLAILFALLAILGAVGAWSYFQKNRVALALFLLPGLCTAAGAVLARGTMYPRFYFSFIGFGVLILARGVFAIPEWLATRWPANRNVAAVLKTAIAVILLGASTYSMAANYRYPKQDFESAIEFIDSVSKPGEIIVTAGASTYPIHQYYAKPWEDADSAAKLGELCQQGRVVWLVYTFPRYLESAVPGITEKIHQKFMVVKVFPGTLGDGDLVVTKFQPTT